MLALALLLSSALAAEERPPGDARVYGAARAALSVPLGYTGFATSYGAEVGAITAVGNQIGLRVLWTPNPPDVYGADTPDNAFGPVLNLAHHFRVAPSFDLSPTLALGAVFGPSPEDGTNMVLPAIQIGLGARFRIATGDGYLAIGPELGVIPTLGAPVMALNVAWVAPPAAAVD